MESGRGTGARGATAERLGAWWSRERLAVTEGTGRGVSAVRWVAARPVAVLLPVAALFPGLFGAAIPDGDAGWFREAGLSMLGSDVLDVFSSSGLQIGPLYLLLVGLLAATCELLGLPVLFTVAAVQSTALAAYAMHLSGRWAKELGTSARRARWGVVGPLVLLGPLAESIGNGHPEELLLGLMLAHLVLLARARRAHVMGLLLGLMVGLKLWGVLAAPVVLLARRWRVLVVAGSWAAGLAGVVYLPFALGGEMNTFAFSWGARLAPFGIELQGAWLSGWGFRIVQAAAVVAVASLVAARWPGTGLGTALTIVAARIVLDPMLQMYYTIPFLVLALLWVWTAPHASLLWAAASWPGVLVAMVGPYLVPGTLRIAVTHVALVGITAVIVRCDAKAQAASAPSGDGTGCALARGRQQAVIS